MSGRFDFQGEPSEESNFQKSHVTDSAV